MGLLAADEEIRAEMVISAKDNASKQIRPVTGELGKALEALSDLMDKFDDLNKIDMSELQTSLSSIEATMSSMAASMKDISTTKSNVLSTGSGSSHVFIGDTTKYSQKKLDSNLDAQNARIRAENKKLRMDNAHYQELLDNATRTAEAKLNNSEAHQKSADAYTIKANASKGWWEYRSEHPEMFTPLRQQARYQAGNAISGVGDQIKSLGVGGFIGGSALSALGKGIALGPVAGFGAAVVSATEGLKKFATASLEAFGQIESIKTQLSVVMGNDTQSNKLFSDIAEYATESPFGVEQTSEMAVLLRQSGVYASDLMRTMRMIGDTAGGNMEKMKRIANNYAQIVSIGKASMLDMRQFAYAGIPIFKEVSKELGVSQSRLRSMISDGKVTAEVIQKVFENMTGAGGIFENATAKGAETYQARLQNLKDTKQLAMSEVGELIINLGDYNGEGGLASRALSWSEGVYDALASWSQKENIGHNIEEIKNNRGSLTSLKDTREYLTENKDTLEKQGINVDELINNIDKEMALLSAAISPSKQYGVYAQAYDLLAKQQAKQAESIMNAAQMGKIAPLLPSDYRGYSDRNNILLDNREGGRVFQSIALTNNDTPMTEDFLMRHVIKIFEDQLGRKLTGNETAADLIGTDFTRNDLELFFRAVETVRDYNGILEKMSKDPAWKYGLSNQVKEKLFNSAAVAANNPDVDITKTADFQSFMSPLLDIADTAGKSQSWSHDKLDSLQPLTNQTGKAFQSLASAADNLEMGFDTLTKKAGSYSNAKDIQDSYYKQTDKYRQEQLEKDKKIVEDYNSALEYLSKKDFGSNNLFSSEENFTGMSPADVKKYLDFQIQAGNRAVYTMNELSADNLYTALGDVKDEAKDIFNNWKDNAIPQIKEIFRSSFDDYGDSEMKRIGFDDIEELFKSENADSLTQESMDFFIRTVSSLVSKIDTLDIEKNVKLVMKTLLLSSGTGSAEKLDMSVFDKTEKKAKEKELPKYTDLWKRILESATGIKADYIEKGTQFMELYRPEVMRNIAQGGINALVSNGAGFEEIGSRLVYNGVNSLADRYFQSLTKIDLSHRPQVPESELKKAGWEEANGNGTATVYSSTFSSKDFADLANGEEVAINVTPILPNGEVLSPQELDEYVYDIFHGKKSGEDIVLGRYTGEGAIQEAEKDAEALHLDQARVYSEGNNQGVMQINWEQTAQKFTREALSMSRGLKETSAMLQGLSSAFSSQQSQFDKLKQTMLTTGEDWGTIDKIIKGEMTGKNLTTADRMDNAFQSISPASSEYTLGYDDKEGITVLDKSTGELVDSLKNIRTDAKYAGSKLRDFADSVKMDNVIKALDRLEAPLKAAAKVISANNSLQQEVVSLGKTAVSARTSSLGGSYATMGMLRSVIGGNTGFTTLENGGKEYATGKYVSASLTKFLNFVAELDTKSTYDENAAELKEYGISREQYGTLAENAEALQNGEDEEQAVYNLMVAFKEVFIELIDRAKAAADAEEEGEQVKEADQFLNEGLYDGEVGLRGRFINSVKKNGGPMADFINGWGKSDDLEKNGTAAMTKAVLMNPGQNKEMLGLYGRYVRNALKGTEFEGSNEEKRIVRNIEGADYEGAKAEFESLGIDGLDFDTLIDGANKFAASMAPVVDQFASLSAQGATLVSQFASSALTSSLSTMGENLALGNSASKGISDNLRKLGAGLLQNMGTLMTEAGLSMIISAGANKAQLYAGLALAAAGGSLSFLGGYYGADNDDDSDTEDEYQRLQAIKEDLTELLKQAREDSIYYEKTARHKNAISANEGFKTQKVNDAIITPSGNVISTAPDDYLIATKTPGALAGGGAPTVNFSVVDKSTGIKVTQQSTRYDEDTNTFDFEAVIESKVQEVIATSKGDSAFNMREARLRGRTLVM